MRTKQHLHLTFQARTLIYSLLLCATSISTNCFAEANRYASIIIDDIGNNQKTAQQIIDLPASITLSILPSTTYARAIAQRAKDSQREVMLHLPLQSIKNHKTSPGTLKLHMTETEFLQQLREDIAAVPHISGINNHMGSLLTRHPGYMSWLMNEIANNGDLFFVDSKTSSLSIAAKIADEYAIPNMSRDVFLDPDHHAGTLDKQFKRFINIVNRRGYALAIAHPYPETIAFLREHLDELKQQGIEIVPVSQLIQAATTNATTPLKKPERLPKPLPKQTSKKYVTCTGTTCAGL
jgi:polysaccharide deacetylase 2 family uncharacterized protein YibQ